MQSLFALHHCGKNFASRARFLDYWSARHLARRPADRARSICSRCPLRVLCENSDVELTRRRFVSITLNNKRIAVAVTVERRKERKQFCVFSARARFHTARVNRVRLTVSLSLPLSPR